MKTVLFAEFTPALYPHIDFTCLRYNNIVPSSLKLPMDLQKLELQYCRQWIKSLHNHYYDRRPSFCRRGTSCMEQS